MNLRLNPVKLGTIELWAPRLIDLGLIKVLNETVADADMTIDGKCPSELNHGRSYAAIASGFTARVSSQVNRIRL